MGKINSLIANIIKSFQDEYGTPLSPFLKKVVGRFMTVLLAVYEITPPADKLLDDYCPNNPDRMNDIKNQLEAYIAELEEWIVMISVQYSDVRKTAAILHHLPAAPAAEDFLENVNKFREEVGKILPEFNRTLEEYRKSYYKLKDMTNDLQIKKPYNIEEEDPW